MGNSVNDPKNILVTIAIPFYNTERYLSFAIQSVINQTWRNWELLLIDDGSKDHSLEIAKSFAAQDKRIKVISDGKNLGISYRLNQQIDLAQGKFFVRMDGDDLMFPYRVEKQLVFLQEHTNIDVCGGQAVVIGDENEIIGKRGKVQAPKNVTDVFLYGRFIHPTVMGKTEWFRKWRYREDMSGCEDLDLWIRSYNGSTFGVVPSPVLFYRDPLVFKMRTFMYRNRRIMACYWANRRLLPSISTLIRCYGKVAIATAFTIVLRALGLDKLWIKRRNVRIPVPEKEKYEEILIKTTADGRIKRLSANR